MCLGVGQRHGCLFVAAVKSVLINIMLVIGVNVVVSLMVTLEYENKY